MTVGKIKIDGSAEFAMNSLICVCGHCGNHDNENATVEFNFREQKIVYSFSGFKQMNVIVFGNPHLPPMPQTRMG